MPFLHENNTFIMKSFTDAGYRKRKLEILNHICMYIKTISLADITNSKGDLITQKTWKLKVATAFVISTTLLNH